MPLLLIRFGYFKLNTKNTMKKIVFSLLLLMAIALPSFSQRVLTDEERESLIADPSFIYHSQWAVRNYAAYWSIHDGSSLSPEAARIKWAKDRMISVKIVNYDINDNNLSLRFIKLSKGITFSLGAAPQPPATIVAAFVAGNRFDELSSLYFDLLADEINMSIGN